MEDSTPFVDLINASQQLNTEQPSGVSPVQMSMSLSSSRLASLVQFRHLIAAPRPFCDSTVPVSSPLNISKVSILDNIQLTPIPYGSTYKLPQRQNQGMQLDRFSLEGKVRYTNANYVSCERIAPERNALVNYMDSIKIPTKVEEPRWKKLYGIRSGKKLT